MSKAQYRQDMSSTYADSTYNRRNQGMSLRGIVGIWGLLDRLSEPLTWAGWEPMTAEDSRRPSLLNAN